MARELWVVTKGIRLWIQTAKMRFLRTPTGFGMRDTVRSQAVQRALELSSRSAAFRGASWGCLAPGRDANPSCASLWMYTNHGWLRGHPRAGLGLAGEACWRGFQLAWELTGRIPPHNRRSCYRKIYYVPIQRKCVVNYVSRETSSPGLCFFFFFLRLFYN